MLPICKAKTTYQGVVQLGPTNTSSLGRRDIWGRPGSIRLRRLVGLGLWSCFGARLRLAWSRENALQHGP